MPTDIDALDFDPADDDYGYEVFDSDVEAIERRCLAAIETWPIEAIGRRPADFLCARPLTLQDLA